MHKKLLLIAPALILGSSLLIGAGTYALFSTNTTNSGNAFTAGTLNIRLDHQDTDKPYVAYFNITDMAPGDSQVVPVTISSTGTIALTYTMSVTFGGFLGIHDDNHLIYSVYPSMSDADAGTNQIDLSKQRSLDAKGSSHDSETMFVKITLPSGANNDYQSQSGTAIIRVSAQQGSSSASQGVSLENSFNDNALQNFDRGPHRNYFLSLPNGPITYTDANNSIQFASIPSSGNNNVYFGVPTTYAVNTSTGHTKLWLLVDGVNGNQQDIVTVHYSDGSQQTTQIYAPDWIFPGSYPGVYKAWTGQAYENYFGQYMTASMYATYVPLDSTKNVQAITFGVNSNVAIWGATLG